MARYRTEKPMSLILQGYQSVSRKYSHGPIFIGCLDNEKSNLVFYIIIDCDKE